MKFDRFLGRVMDGLVGIAVFCVILAIAFWRA